MWIHSTYVPGIWTCHWLWSMFRYNRQWDDREEEWCNAWKRKPISEIGQSCGRWKLFHIVQVRALEMRTWQVLVAKWKKRTNERKHSTASNNAGRPCSHILVVSCLTRLIYPQIYFREWRLYLCEWTSKFNHLPKSQRSRSMRHEFRSTLR